MTSISTGSTAFGPLALAFGRDLTGSYVEVLLVLLLLPAVVIVAGLLAPPPGRQPRPSRRGTGA